MRLQTITAVVLGSVISIVQALELAKRENPSVVNLSFEKRHDERSPLRKRANNGPVQTNPSGILRYYVNYTLGTPPQPVWAQLDTGSGNLVVFGPGLDGCGPDRCIGGIYQPQNSSTSNNLNHHLSYVFSGGQGYTGGLYTDTIAFGNAQVPSFEFIVMDSWQNPGGNTFSSYLGVGFPSIEGSFSTTPYPNLPVALKNVGAIATAAFSLYLNGPGAQTGQILFGGVNRAKYQGPLVTFDIPINPDVGVVDTYLAPITAISLTTDGSSKKLDFEPQYGDLDSGTSTLILPGNLITSLVNNIGGTFASNLGLFIAPCSVANGNTTLDFSLGGLTIRVPLSDVVVQPHIYLQSDESILANGVDQCVVTVASGSKLFLGDTFLRSAYAVFDVDNKQVSLAQANFGSTTDDIVDIIANSTVPGATVLGGLPSTVKPYDAQTAVNPSATEITATATTTTRFHTTAPAGSTTSAGGAKKGDAISGVSGQLNLFSLGAALFGSLFLDWFS
jgi:Eukaryotic aspartyl protease